MIKVRGFTLVEVLISLTLMSLLTVVLFSGFRVGVKSWSILNTHIDNTEAARSVQELLYRHFSQFHAAMLRDNQFRPAPAFLGESTRIRYVAPLSISTGNIPYLIEMYSDPQAGPGIFIRYTIFQNTLSADELLSHAKTIKIDKNLSIKFSYFLTEQWKDYLPVGGIPNLVRVTIFRNNEAISTRTFEILTASSPSA